MVRIASIAFITFFVGLASTGCKSSGGSGSPADAAVSSNDRPSEGGNNATCNPDDLGAGESCSCSSQCATGFCTDGVCCESACGDNCMSCAVIGSAGTCTPVPAGGPPRVAAGCVAEEKSSCGLDGTCDGTGQCRNHVEGTVCKPGACEGDAIVGTYVCDGDKGCRQSATTVCAPFSCDPTTNQCFAKCATDLNCVSGRKCVGASCGPKMNGSVCEKDADCASEHCSGGVCCNTACDGACRSCNLVGKVGSCQPLTQGLRDVMCTPQAATTCGTTGLCDGFGSCGTYPNSTICGPSTCSGATAVNIARTCDGSGSCPSAVTQSCGSYRCASGRCNTRCTTAAECADGVACVNNNCGPKVDGQSCTANADCLNQHCVRDTASGPGICCNTDCAGACRTCALAGALGKCTPINAGGSDPRGMCATTSPSTCGTDGKCDGIGTCRTYAAGAVCGAESCVNDVYTPSSVCNGAGMCVKAATQSCTPYHCNANRCFAACTANAQCVAPSTCGMNGVISSCGLKPLGATCSAAAECSSNFCAQGVCCNSACGTACHACNLAGSAGTCSNVNSGADPRGLCAAQAASTCGTTGQCSAGACARWAVGTQCRAASCLNASTVTTAGSCNGAGVCGAGTSTACAPGRCDAATSRCSTVCTTDAQCTAPAVCAGGSCGQKLGNGAVCASAAACASGFCVDGRCCGTACTGACQTCGNAAGTCGAVANGTADASCGAAAPPCGRTGLCTNGACAVAANGTTCADPNACGGAATCMAGVCTTTPGSGMSCMPIDECHLAGTCTNGTCSNPNAPASKSCGAGPTCTGGVLTAQGHCGSGDCVAGASSPCPSGACATGSTCSTGTMPTCGLVELCRGNSDCVCPAGRSCSPMLGVCIPN